MVHFWWLVKRDLTRPEIMAVILSLLLGFRVLDRLLSNRTVASETVSQER